MTASNPSSTWQTPIRKADVFSSSPSKPSPLSGKVLPRTPFASPYRSNQSLRLGSVRSSGTHINTLLSSTVDSPIAGTPRSRSAPTTLARRTQPSCADTPTFASRVPGGDRSGLKHNPTFGPPGDWVVMKSIDGERFWVSREVFDRYCGYLDLRPPSPLHKIRLSASSAITQILLEILHTDRSRWHPHISQTALKDLIGFYELCQAVEADPVASTVKDEIARRAEQDPWGVIEFASGLGDIELGRKGIRCLRGGGGDRLKRGRWKAEEFEDMEPGWFIELLRLKEKHTISVTPGHQYRSPSTVKSPLTPTRLIVSIASPVRTVSGSYRSPVTGRDSDRYSPLKSTLRGGARAGTEDVIDWLAVAREFDP